MRGQKWFMGLLLAACTVTAVGVWSRQEAPRPEARAAKGFAGLKGGLSAGTPALTVLTIDGVILEDAEPGAFGSGGGASARHLTKLVSSMHEDPPKALILRINSPGGSAAASDAVYRELVRLKQAKGVKIVAMMGDVAASGGYMIAAAADRIVANPATLTGSIGVIMQLANYEGLMGKVGVRSVTIKAGRLKDIGAPDRAMTREERALLQGIVDDSYEQFLEIVAAGRKMPLAKVRSLAEGRIYTGRQAKAAGLVDELGTMEAAVQAARKLAKLGPEEEPGEVDGDEWNRLLRMLASRPEPLATLAGRRAQLIASGYERVPLMLME